MAVIFVTALASIVQLRPVRIDRTGIEWTHQSAVGKGRTRLSDERTSFEPASVTSRLADDWFDRQAAETQRQSFVSGRAAS